MKVLENTTIEGESPVIEHSCPTLDNVPKCLPLLKKRGSLLGRIKAYRALRDQVQRRIWCLSIDVTSTSLEKRLIYYKRKIRRLNIQASILEKLTCGVSPDLDPLSAKITMDLRKGLLRGRKGLRGPRPRREPVLGRTTTALAYGRNGRREVVVQTTGPSRWTIMCCPCDHFDPELDDDLGDYVDLDCECYCHTGEPEPERYPRLDVKKHNLFNHVGLWQPYRGGHSQISYKKFWKLFYSDLMKRSRAFERRRFFYEENRLFYDIY
jgi:hypothetical protein